MLEFAGSVCLGVYVAYLLELQGTLKSHGVVQIPAYEEHGIVVKVVGRKVLYVLGVFKHLLHLCGQAQQLVHDAGVLLLRHGAEYVAEVQTQHIEQHELSAVSLRGRNGDLRSRPCVQHVVGLSCDGAADHVHDGQDVSAERLRLTQSRHCVERLTRLAYHDDKGAGIDERVAVAEFRRKADLDRLSEHTLKVVLAHHTDMI